MHMPFMKGDQVIKETRKFYKEKRKETGLNIIEP
jgi:hypothetical protein